MIISLNGKWLLKSKQINDIEVTIPGSVISGLLENKIIDNPYKGLNEEATRNYLYDDCSFKKEFKLDKTKLNKYNYLCLEGIDTVSKVLINGKIIAETKDFHISKRVLLDESLLKENNLIEVQFVSNYRYINEYDDKGLFKTYSETDPKSVVIRKPNYMFGWDWAPNLADMGIGNIYILSTDEGYLDNFRYEYAFKDDNSLELNLAIEYVKHGDSPITVSISYSGKIVAEKKDILQKYNKFLFKIQNPILWYPNGLGEQALYDLKIVTNENEYHYQIGFKKVHFDFSKNKNGRNFEVFINGHSTFLKGYNIIPEDNILSLINNQRTNKMLELVKESGANVIRIWGGGYYPSDYFYRRCDELGIMVWQDLMFADAAYNVEDKDFMSLVHEENDQQVKRIRNFPSVILICGNNENETALNGHEEIYKEHFIKMFCNDIKDIVEKLTSIQYLHSSPTNLDPIFNRPNDPNIFDVHYWEVGNGPKPYEAYGEIYPPMLSEFGLWSMPNYETLIKYISKDKQYLYSDDIKFHNKRETNFLRVETYITKKFHFNEDLQVYCYLTQLYQARGFKYCIEHLRNNLSRCHGGIIWQFNDSWPVVSCSLVDYEYGLKASYFYAKRFFNNELVTISNKDGVIRIHVSNLDSRKHHYQVIYKHMTFDNYVYKEDEYSISLKPNSSVLVNGFDSPLKHEDEFIYVELINEEGHIISRNIYQAIEDKDINYPEADIQIERIDKATYKVTTKTFVKDLYLFADGATFSDNYLTMLKNESIIIKSNVDLDARNISIICINNL